MRALAAPEILEGASDRIALYNRYCLHYNLAADAIYAELRRTRAPLSCAYQPFLVAGLIAFDVGRSMGQGWEQKYDPDRGGFACRLRKKLEVLRPLLEPLTVVDIFGLHGHALSHNVPAIYDELSTRAPDGLSSRGDSFHVGATKVLHFINPGLFPIVDSYTARVMRRYFGIPYRNTTQPGYSGQRYSEVISGTRDALLRYGEEKFRLLEAGTPALRVFDKIAFAIAAGW